MDDMVTDTKKELYNVIMINNTKFKQLSNDQINQYNSKINLDSNGYISDSADGFNTDSNTSLLPIKKHAIKCEYI